MTKSVEKCSGHDYVKSIHQDRWDGIIRPYSLDVIEKLRAFIGNDPTISRKTSDIFFGLLKQEKGVRTFGVDNPVEAVNSVRGGNKVVYESGWMIAANTNKDGVYPDMGLYDAGEGPNLASRLNTSFSRAYQTDAFADRSDIDWHIPIFADCEAGFGGINNVRQITTKYIMAGVAGLHLEDQDPSQRRCGHMGGKVVIPTSSFIDKLIAARLTMDIYNVPGILIARTDALSAQYMAGYTEDMMPVDGRYIRGKGEKGLFPFGDPSKSNTNLEAAIERGLAYAPYADLLWMETGTPNLGVAKEFADAIHDKFPEQDIAYNLSPSFKWRKNLSENEIRRFMDGLTDIGYKLQFSTLLTWRAKGINTFEIARKFHNPDIGMLVLAEIQDMEEEAIPNGYMGIKHQTNVGSGDIDIFSEAVLDSELRTAAGGERSTEHQFDKKPKK